MVVLHAEPNTDEPLEIKNKEDELLFARNRVADRAMMRADSSENAYIGLTGRKTSAHI